jgi:hypothetical protein
MTPKSIAKKLFAIWSLWRRVPEDSKYLWRWFDSLLPGHFPLRDERPWITFKAIEWLNNYLKPEMRVFEFGSGGSTIFLCRRAKDVYTVEHDSEYAGVVQKALEEKGLNNCDYRLIPPITDEDSSIQYSLESCRSFMERWSKLDFSDYVCAIDSFPDGFFDLVVVDGRSRVSCLARSLVKVRQNGWILLDNSERPGYKLGCDLLSGYLRHDFFGLVPSNLELYQTSVWQLHDAPESRMRFAIKLMT